MSFVQEFGVGSTSSIGGPITLAAPSIPIGATLIVPVAITGGAGNAIPIVTDDAGNTYTLVASETVTDSTSKAFVLYSNITNGTPGNMVISFSASIARSAVNVAHFDETLVPGPSAVNDNSGISTATILVGPTVPVPAGSLVFGAGVLVNSGRTFTGTNGMTTLTKRTSMVGGGDRAVISAYKYADADAGQTLDGTLVGSGIYGGIVQTFSLYQGPPPITGAVLVGGAKKSITSQAVIVGGAKKPITGRFIIFGGIKKATA